MIRKIKTTVKRIVPFLSYTSVDIDLRYTLAAKYLKGYLRDKPTILDVGSAGYGVAKYINYPVTGLDVDFGAEIHDLLTPVYQKEKEFPFKDNSFDFVVSVDTLEHIPKKDREKFILELVRVAKRGVMIIVPAGKLSEIQDKLLSNLYLSVHGEKHHYLKEHVENGLPRVEETKLMISENCRRKGKSCTIKTYKSVNLSFREFYMRLFINSNPISKKTYRLLSLFSPIWSQFNFGSCYRSIFVVEIK